MNQKPRKKNAKRIARLERAVVDACLAMATAPRENGKPIPECCTTSLEILDRAVGDLLKELGDDVRDYWAMWRELYEPEATKHQS